MMLRKQPDALLKNWNKFNKNNGDEVLSSELKAEIEQTIQSNQLDALITPINDVFLGVPNSKHTKKHAKVRFFRKSKGRYDLENKVHENVIIEGTSVRANGDIYHYGESSIFVKVEKNNQYSELKAKEKFEKAKHPSLLKLMLVVL